MNKWSLRKSDLEGHPIRLNDFRGEVFHLTYAGWDDQWIVRNAAGVDMLRCSAQEAQAFLLPDDRPCGWSEVDERG